MFVALRDLSQARGRFVLMSAVVVLITFLVTFLAALTAGLAAASTSAVTALPADHLAFSMPAGDAPDFTSSQVTSEQWEGWAQQPGVAAAEPLGVATTRAQTAGSTASVTAFGAPGDSSLVPAHGGALEDGTIVLTPAAGTALDARVGDTVTIGSARLVVAGTTDQDESFSHTPVVWTTLRDWQAIGARGAGDGAADLVATVVALRTDDADVAAADETLGTTTVTTADARSAVSSFAGENLSLTTMQAFLLVISALVVGAFFTVWTISRSGDVAVLKALGASTRYLLRDALGQATVLLLGGTVIGAGLAVGGAALMPDEVPVAVSVATTVAPAAILLMLGLLGAGVAIARIGRIDPHAALSAR